MTRGQAKGVTGTRRNVVVDREAVRDSRSLSKTQEKPRFVNPGLGLGAARTLVHCSLGATDGSSPSTLTLTPRRTAPHGGWYFSVSKSPR